MMDTAIATMISLLGIYGVVFWLYRDYRVDTFRQSMFSLRDKLFDFAIDGGIGFDHPAYMELRELINGYIRFGHQIRLMPGILFAYSIDEDDQAWLSEHSFDTRWDEVTNDLDVPTARVLYDYKRMANHKLYEHLILGSSVLVCTIVPAVILIVALWLGVGIIRRLLDRMRESIEIFAALMQQPGPGGSTTGPA